MKRNVFILLLALFAFNASYAQMELKELVESVDWHGTEQDFVSRFSANVVNDSKQVWAEEESESNYRLKDVTVCGRPLLSSYVRVNQTSKKLFRVNLNLLSLETDPTIYQMLREDLINAFGAPCHSVVMEDKDVTDVWVFNNCRIKGSLIYLRDKYVYGIGVEPVYTYFVDWTQAIVESNNARSPIAQIEYFRTDDKNNVYIKEVGKKEVVKEKVKLLPTPKGNVITFDGGMFCHRPEDNDVVYIKYGLAITYPIVKK